jgi:hypothetical protein
MNQSELILKTYREITSRLQRPYYVLEGIPSNNGRNNMLYSSPGLKDVFGLSQFDLSSDPQQFFDSIHADYVKDYLESNQRLLRGSHREKRIYLVKNKETGNFIPVEEVASSRLNRDRNCYEIYCSLRSINNHIDQNSSLSREEVSKVFSKNLELTSIGKESIHEIAQHFVETLASSFKMNACRFYGFNADTNELTILGDVQNKKAKQLLESTTRVRTRNVVPKYSAKSTFFHHILKKEYTILESKEDVVNVLRDHTDSTIIKKLAGTAIKMYNIKSFGVLPICCHKERLVGLVTFGSPQLYTEDQKKGIYDFTTTTANIFTSMLGDLCKEK